MTKFNWKETIELVGILAIIASLIALVMELRQTQSAMSAETYQSRAIDAIGELLIVADSEYLAPILTTTHFGADYEAIANLNAVDRLRLQQYLHARMIDWDNEHYQYQNGFIEADFFAATTTRNVKIWAPRWRAIGLTEGREAFRIYVDDILHQDSQSAE